MSTYKITIFVIPWPRDPFWQQSGHCRPGPSVLLKVKLSTIDEVYLSSSSDAQTFVNGRLLNGRIELKSGSRIIFGAAHVFRFVHPSKIQTLKNEMNSGNDYPSQGKIIWRSSWSYFHDRGSSRDTKIENQLFIGRSDVRIRLDFKRSRTWPRTNQSLPSTANQDVLNHVIIISQSEVFHNFRHFFQTMKLA